MAEIESIGVAFDTSGVDKGTAALNKLADTGPKVDKALQSVENTVTRTGKSLATLGQSSPDAGLTKVAQSSREASDGLNKLADGAGKSVSAVKDVSAASQVASESMLSMVRTGVGAFLAGAVVQGAKSAATAIYEASASAERLRTTLNFATNGKSAQELDYLRGVTDRLGLQFTSTAQAYAKFQAASKGTALEGAKAREVFESIAKASAVMGLTAEESSGALLALQQMLSKGTVQSEELRGQLGERLPVAMRIAAKAMNVTESELGKMLEQGQVIAYDFLPKFARALNEDLGGAADNAAARLDAATYRMGSAWDRIKQSVGDAGVSKVIQTEILAITDHLNVFSETMKKVEKAGYGFFSQIAVASAAEAGRAGFAILNGAFNLMNGTINTLTNSVFNLNTNMALLPDILKTDAQQAVALERDLAAAEKKFADLKAQGGTEGGNIYWKSELFQLSQYIQQLKQARDEKQALQRGNTDSQAGDTYRTAAAAAEAKRLEGVQASMQKVIAGLSGVKDGFYKDLNSLYEGYKSGLINLSSYQKEVAKLINESGGGKTFAASAKEATKQFEEQRRLVGELNGLSGDFYKDWDDLAQLFKSGKLKGGVDELVKLQEALLAKQPFYRTELEKNHALAKANYAQELQYTEEIAAAYVAESKAREAGRLAIYEYAKGIDEQNDLTQLELSLMGKTQRERDVAIAQYRVELDLKKRIAEIDKNAGFDEAQREEERAKARAAAERAKENAETAAQIKEIESAVQSVESTAQRVWTDVANGGQDAFKRVGQTLKAAVLDVLYQATVKQWVVRVATSVLGGNASLVSAATGSSGLSGVSGLASLGSNIGSLLGGASSWLTNFTGSASVAAADLGSWLYNQGFEGLGKAFASNSGAIGDVLGVAGDAIGYLNAFRSLTNGSYGAAAGSALGTFFGGPIGAGIGSVIGSVVDKLFGSTGTPHSGAGYVSDGTTGFDVKNGQYGLGGAQGDSTGRYYNQGVEDALKSITGGAASLLNSLSASFGGAGGYQVGGYFASDNNRGSNYGQSVLLNGSVIAEAHGNNLDKDATKGLEQLADQIATQVRGVIDQIDIPGWAKDSLKALGSDAGFDELNTAVQAIIATQQALKQLGDTMPQLAGLTDNAVTGLLTAMGGIQNLTTAASSYYDNFYSDAEKSAAATKALTEAMAGLGFAVPGTRDAYRQLVEAQDLNTESGLAAYSALLKLSPAFAALVPAAEDAAEAIDTTAQKMAEAGQKALASLAEQQGTLMVDLLRAQGDAAGADALARQQAIAKVIAGLSDADAAAAIAALDYNTALQAQIDALKEATSASEKAAAAEVQRLAAVANERDSIQARIDELLGDQTAIRERELNAIDAANRDLQLRLYAIQDEQKATQDAAAAAAQAAQALAAFQSVLDGLGDTRFDLENQLLSLQGNDAEVAARTRERELARLTAGLSAEEAAKVTAAYDYNTALQAQIAASQEAQKQAEAYAAAQNQAAADAVRAAESIANAWKSASASLLDEVARIRGTMQDDAGTSFAASQAKFAITLAQAQAGDLDAAKLLPGLSQAMLSIGEQQAVSLSDLQSLRARTAGSLEAAANAIAATYGVAAAQAITGVTPTSAATAPTTYTVAPIQASNYAATTAATQADLVTEIKGLRAQVEILRGQLDVSNSNTDRTARKLEGEGGPIFTEIDESQTLKVKVVA